MLDHRQKTESVYRCNKCSYTQAEIRTAEGAEKASRHISFHVFVEHPDLLDLDALMDTYYELPE